MIALSIIIKALNEEENIARCIESCMRVCAETDAEIILADSGSTDQTVAIAKRYPVTVVQVRDRSEGRCGAGPQLGYQVSAGRYLYLIDGDMELDPVFIATAIAYLEQNPKVAGFGGVIREMHVHNLEFESRKRRDERYAQRKGQTIERPHEREYLSGGALYRREAIEDAGYLTDRNLHANEEYDLGSRLRLKGWVLIRSHETAVNHYSHTKPTFSLMWYRVRSGMIFGVGEIVRAAAASGYLANAIRDVKILRIAVGLCGVWIATGLLALMLRSVVPWSGLLLPVAVVTVLTGFMTFRHGSIKLALFSLLTWHLAVFGLLGGLLARRRDPRQPIEANVLTPTGQETQPPVLARAS